MQANEKSIPEASAVATLYDRSHLATRNCIIVQQVL